VILNLREVEAVGDVKPWGSLGRETTGHVLETAREWGSQTGWNRWQRATALATSSVGCVAHCHHLGVGEVEVIPPKSLIPQARSGEALVVESAMWRGPECG